MRLFCRRQHCQAINLSAQLHMDVSLIPIGLSQLIMIAMRLPASNRYIVPATMQLTSNMLMGKINNVDLISSTHLLTPLLWVSME